MDEVYAALAHVPFFENVRKDTIKLERLDEVLTNVCYKVTVGSVAYVLRLAGEGTSDYIDRSAEEYNARVAAAAGVGAEVVYFDARDGTMVTRFIEGVSMNAGEGFDRDPGRRFGPLWRSSGFIVWGRSSGIASTFSPRSKNIWASCASGERRYQRVTTR
ncbi:MAG TPA: hypothetical protein VIZ60_06710 [Rubrobacter sp.]